MTRLVNGAEKTLMPDSRSGPLLLCGRDAARLCGTSERTWRTWDAGGLIPAAMTIGRARFWRAAELRAWVAEGCPTRDAWVAETAERSF